MLSIRTCEGFEKFGKFRLGNNRQIAYRVFHMLRGSENIDEKNMLQLELMEIRNGLPYNIQMISCSLEDLAENCKIITKETFKHFNLEAK